MSIFEVIIPVQYFLCVALLFRRKFQVLVQRLLWQQPRQLRRSQAAVVVVAAAFAVPAAVFSGAFRTDQ